MHFTKIALAAAIIAPIFVTPVVAQNWPSETNAAWDTLLAAGQAEGELVLAGDATLSGAFIEKFESDTGINISFISGHSRGVLARFTREVESGSPTIDVFLGGPNTFQLIDGGYLMDIKSKLVLPEVTDPANWRQGEIPFADERGVYMPVPSYYLSGRVLVNTNMVDPETIKTWDDLLRPEFKGAIISQFAPTFGGGLAVASYLYEQKGGEFVEDLYLGQDIQYTGEYRVVTDSVARGTYAIGLSAAPNDITRFKNEGIDYIEVLGMTDVEGYIVAGASLFSASANSARPNAVAVFANWYLSKNGQEAFSAARKVPSERLDVTGGDWPVSIEPLEGRSYKDDADQIWRTVGRRPLQDAVNVILGN